MNYIKERIDNTRRNNNCRMGGDKDDRVIHLIIECSKLGHKNKTQQEMDEKGDL